MARLRGIRKVAPFLSHIVRSSWPLALPSHQPIEAVLSGADGGNKQEEETVGNGQLTFVLYGPEAMGSVHLEVGHGHLARREERCYSSKEA